MMPFDPQTLPVGGGVLVAGLIYAGASYFVTGPLIGERMIAKSDWSQSCEVSLAAQIETQRTPPKIIPKTDCSSLLGRWMPELNRLCQQYGNPDFGGPTVEVLRQQESQRQEAEARRLAQVAANSGSRCSCATAVFVEEQRVSLALYAGSGRLITPAPIQNLKSSLTTALHAPLCALDGSVTG